MRDKGLLDEAAATRAQSLLAEGRPLEDAVLAADGLAEETVLRFLAQQFDVPYVDAETLEKTTPGKEFLATFPARLLLRHQILPLEERDGVTVVAISRLTNHGALDELRLASGRDVMPALAPAAEIDRALKKLLGVGADTLQTLNADGNVEVID